jgi:hypothetical protein
MKKPRILHTECHSSEMPSVFKLLRPLYYTLFSVCPTLIHKMKHLPSFERIRYLQADTATAYVHCMSVDINIFTKQSKLDMFARGMPVCATHNSESLRQVHTAFTVFDPSCKYAEIEWIFKYGYSRGSNVIKPITDEGSSDNSFITGCQFAFHPELPIEEVNTLPPPYILCCDHDITAENGADAGFILLFTVNGTCY